MSTGIEEVSGGSTWFGLSNETRETLQISAAIVGAIASAVFAACFSITAGMAIPLVSLVTVLSGVGGFVDTALLFVDAEEDNLITVFLYGALLVAGAVIGFFVGGGVATAVLGGLMTPGALFIPMMLAKACGADSADSLVTQK